VRKLLALHWIVPALLASGCMDVDALQPTGTWRTGDRSSDNPDAGSDGASDFAPVPVPDANSPQDTVTGGDATRPDGSTGLLLDGSAPPNPAVVVLPDTQFYAAAYPEIFRAQTKWIADNRDSANLVAVLHEGDLVDDPTSLAQWQVASDAFATLDGVIPYLVLATSTSTMTTQRTSCCRCHRRGRAANYGLPLTASFVVAPHCQY